jgi:bacterioferritin
MKGHDSVLNLLNELLTHELTAINQYFLDVKMLENWGYPRLAAWFREAAMAEMKDAEGLMDRILYLEGLPNLQRLGTVRTGEDAPEKLRLALDVEVTAVNALRDGIKHCTDVGDHGTRQQLEEMVIDEEQHIDWLETEIGLIAALGEPLYLARQTHA